MMRLVRDRLLRGWAALVALGAGTGLAALGIEAGLWAPPLGAAILTLAWLKARLILARYLGLDEAPAWRRGFDTAVAAFLLLLLGLYLVPAIAEGQRVSGGVVSMNR